MGGSDESSNLVRLTPEEHYLAHQLLVKIFPDNNSVISAAVMMIPNRPSNKLYGWLRRKFSESQSERMSGDGNTQFGSRWIYNLELRQTRKILNTENVPDGWSLGRIIDFDLHFSRIEESQKLIQEKERLLEQKKIQDSLARDSRKKQKDESKESYKLMILDLYDKFISGDYYSVSDFHRQNNIQISRMTLTNYWREYIPEYKDKSKEGKCYRK